MPHVPYSTLSLLSLFKSFTCFAKSVKFLIVKVGNEVTIDIEDFNAAVTQVDKEIPFVDEDEGVGAMKLRHLNFFAVNQILYLQRSILRLDQYVLVELLNELHISQHTFECQSHQGLSRVHIYHCHRYLVVLGRINQKHDTVAIINM